MVNFIHRLICRDRKLTHVLSRNVKHIRMLVPILFLFVLSGFAFVQSKVPDTEIQKKNSRASPNIHQKEIQQSLGLLENRL